MDTDLFFSALADRTRLRLLNLMKNGEVCVCFFAEAIGTNNPKISRHLAYLKRAGLVAARRDGKWSHYRITKPASPAAAAIFDTTLEMVASEKEMKEDAQRLEKMTCGPAGLVTISRSCARVRCVYSKSKAFNA